MKLDTSNTLINLARAFAGESQARGRYMIYAEQARTEGLEALARTVEMIAGNEFAHSREFFEHITEDVAQQFNNINIDAGYPFEKGTTAENMRFAAEGEHAEFSRIYPEFARIAGAEGFDRIARIFSMTASVERGHDAVFSELNQRLSSGTLYRRDKPVVWKCANCGFEQIGNEPWDTCPLCSYPRGWVELNLDSRI
jgi:rubrerythrin